MRGPSWRIAVWFKEFREFGEAKYAGEPSESINGELPFAAFYPG